MLQILNYTCDLIPTLCLASPVFVFIVRVLWTFNVGRKLIFSLFDLESQQVQSHFPRFAQALGEAVLFLGLLKDIGQPTSARNRPDSRS